MSVEFFIIAGHASSVSFGLRLAHSTAETSSPLIFERDDRAAGGAAVGGERALRARAAGFFYVHGSPQRRAFAVANERRVAAGDVDAVAFGAVQFGDCRDGPHADADALEIGQRDDAREAAVVFLGDHRQRRTEVHGDAFPGGKVTPRGRPRASRSNSDDA